ncbi:MAG: hypothetical protein ABID64_02470 [Nitrospirota bacterium]
MDSPSNSAERKEAFLAEIRQKEIEMFPQVSDLGYGSTGSKGCYIYFKPSWHIDKGIFSEVDLEVFKENTDKQILSIGAGPALLEQLLVELGMESDQFTLADIDPNVLPPPFTRYIFDRYQIWPQITKAPFDLIIMPENPMVVYHTVKKNSIRVSLSVFYSLIEQALINLKPEGEIRMTGVAIEQENLDLVEKQLTENGYDIEIINADKRVSNCTLITIRYRKTDIY